MTAKQRAKWMSGIRERVAKTTSGRWDLVATTHMFPGPSYTKYCIWTEFIKSADDYLIKVAAFNEEADAEFATKAREDLETAMREIERLQRKLMTFTQFWPLIMFVFLCSFAGSFIGSEISKRLGQ
jgi:hypothetical protein